MSDAQTDQTCDSSPATGRFLPSGDESGSAPEDRAFRPDVAGLRAVAILLVVLFHAGIPSMKGGFVGVDVFFVISGFVITGLLLRERSSTGRTALLPFYARRARPILPVAILVIVVSLISTALLTNSKTTELVASDSRWTAVFLANFRFSAVLPNLFATHPLNLNHYWSLAVEEQFYLFYPAFFLLILALPGRFSLRSRLTAGLTLVVVISFSASVATSRAGQFAAYY